MRTLNILIITIIMSFYSDAALAKKNKQEALDKACEDAREIALKPQRKKIYEECLTKFKKSKEVCKRDAQAYDGRRIGGAPMFYELPACVEAFNYRKKNTK